MSPICMDSRIGLDTMLPGPLFLEVEDQNRTMGVRDAVLANRSEKHPHEFSVTPASYYEERCSPRCLDQS
jgi:hypothetical protein